MNSNRRDFVKLGIATASVGLLGLNAVPAFSATSKGIFAYIGTYTDGGKPWRGGRGLGVHQFVVNQKTGALSSIAEEPLAVLSALGDTAKQRNPAALARHPKLPLLYAANEFETGSVSVFRIKENGALSFVSEMPCGGKGPCYVSVHPDGRFLFTANYFSGDVSVIALQTDGTFDINRTLVVYQDVDACGVATPCKHGADVVPAMAKSHEGFATSDHDGPHAHMVQSDPEGNFVLVADLGLDRLIAYKFDRNSGILSQPTSVAVSESSGARHFVFHPNGKWIYLVNEEASSIAFIRYSARDGALELIRETSALPNGYKGTSYASSICMLPDGKHFVSLNRLHDSLSIFTINAQSGEPTLLRQEWTRGNYPRSCKLDPSGKFLYVCHNKQSDNVTIFRVRGGDVQFTGQFVAVGSASDIAFSA
ncbi:MAG: lactonase family protein [Gammaproteobacteria bacterium]|nr:lactonase family protein [Gammaproteobacteria bacterium]